MLLTNFWKQKVCWHHPVLECFALLPQVNFPANNLNFHWTWRWWDRIQAIFLNLFYFTWILLILNYFRQSLLFKVWLKMTDRKLIRNKSFCFFRNLKVRLIRFKLRYLGFDSLFSFNTISVTLWHRRWCCRPES